MDPVDDKHTDPELVIVEDDVEDVAKPETAFSTLSRIPSTFYDFVWEILSPPSGNTHSTFKDQIPSADTTTTSGRDRAESFSSSSPDDDSGWDDAASVKQSSTFRRSSLPEAVILALEEDRRSVKELHPKSERHSVFDVFDRPISLIGVTDPESVIVTPQLASQLRPHLTPLLRDCHSWKFLYGLSTHGARLATIYETLSTESGSILLAIRDTQNNVFGAVLNEPLVCLPGFYGTSIGSFLWKQTSQNEAKAFPATGRNDYIIFSDQNFVTIGASNGENGIWFDAELYHGHSARCETFDNEPLSSTLEFEIVELEIWGFRH
ncbi:hypothetical protein SmJEL517_g05182 [Synchytrium microbalum]|uniref:Oxidation resistance protein 1 n=1 Tax=Synchytrium microbalum TaxID=1806994 RepID=A0A507BWC9_9FUNG|nr:uncharacterized protein SmJEL517_g05182 [Synchytrium microbalum]TPX31478.1 hypothetical protein SmJEL517_g05182 [Synchytrium microbalum]